MTMLICIAVKATVKACVSDKEEKKNPAKLVAVKVLSSRVKQHIMWCRGWKVKRTRGLLRIIWVMTGCVCSVTSILVCGSQKKKKC
jgi:hypothetical protein